jgi:3',5'-cyclic AMP phosphodiesterase CpdA
MKFSILHISDLHRDLTNELGNGPLLESLVRDVDQRYAGNDPPIAKPSLCVVSGDLVYGAKAGSSNFTDELTRQYAQAKELLVGIADALFEGDRQRVVLVPGNHDVSYNHVLNASQRIPIPTADAERINLVAELFQPYTKLRWSWSNLCFYRITDESLYADRLRAFATAYSDFYQGNRAFSLDPALQFNFFDYPHLDFTILGLNSCDQNDPLNRVASIHPDALAAATSSLRQARYSGRTIAAVWHHSLFGVPTQNDYMDSEMLLHLIDSGVSLGFHGHQHRPQCIEERHQIAGEGRKIVVISASTLCAGPGQLSPGEPRGYNVVEVDTEQRKCRVHQRRMHNIDFKYPIWAPAHFIETNQPFLDLPIDPPLRPRPAHLDAAFKLETAEQILGAKRWKDAIDLLDGAPPDSLGRPLLVKALSEYGDPQATISMLWPPANAAEAVQVGDAILRDGTPEQAVQFLALDIVNKGSDASVVEIARRVRERRVR